MSSSVKNESEGTATSTTTKPQSIPDKVIEMKGESKKLLKNLQSHGFASMTSGYRECTFKFGQQNVHFVTPRKNLQWPLEPKIFNNNNSASSSNFKQKGDKKRKFEEVDKKGKPKISASMLVSMEEIKEPLSTKAMEEMCNQGEIGEIEAQETDEDDSDNGSSDGENENKEQDDLVDFLEGESGLDDTIINIIYSERQAWQLDPEVILSPSQGNYKGTLKRVISTSKENKVFRFKSLSADVPFIGNMRDGNIQYACKVWDGNSTDPKTKMPTKELKLFPIPAGTSVRLHLSPKLYKLPGNPIGLKWTVTQITAYLKFSAPEACLPLYDVPLPIVAAQSNNEPITNEERNKKKIKRN